MDRAVNVSAGDRIYLEVAGTDPDIGVYGRGQITPTPTQTPTPTVGQGTPTPTPTPTQSSFCQVDIDDSGWVEASDLRLMLANYGQYEPGYDQNYDDLINSLDLGWVIGGWGIDCSW